MIVKTFLILALTGLCTASCWQEHLSYSWTPISLHLATELTDEERLRNIDTHELVHLIKTSDDIKIKPVGIAKNEVDCLARNIYFESRNQSLNGQLAVVLVTFNRVQDPRFPKTICGTVYQKNKHGCAFSWVCQGKTVNWKEHLEAMAWFNAYNLALKSYYLKEQMYKADFTHGATFYHSLKVSPSWASNSDWTEIAMIDDHIFYIWKI